MADPGGPASGGGAGVALAVIIASIASAIAVALKGVSEFIGSLRRPCTDEEVEARAEELLEERSRPAPPRKRTPRRRKGTP